MHLDHQRRLFPFPSLHDIYTRLSFTLLPEEKEQVCQASQAHAHEIHQTDGTKPVDLAAIPRDNPDWAYQAGHLG